MAAVSDKMLSSLMQRAQRGDGAAYEQLLDEVGRLIRAFVRGRVPSDHAVEEVVQESLLSIHRARHSYHGSRPFKPWMFAIARHRVTDYLRRWGRTEKKEVEVDGVLETLVTDMPVVDLELNDELAAAVEALPQKQREMIELLKIQGLSVKEVAKQRGMSESAVKVTAHRAYENLRRHFGVGDYAN